MVYSLFHIRKIILKLAIETPLMRNKFYTLYHVNLYGSLIKTITV
jgi:hypothetical protein